jgi:hypothetical protein
MRLLYVFAGAAAAAVSAVWSLGVIDAWWMLAPTFLVYLLAAASVMWSLAQTLSVGEHQAEEPPAELPSPRPRRAPRGLAHFGRLLPH